MKHHFIRKISAIALAIIPFIGANAVDIKQMIKVAEANNSYDAIKTVNINGRFCKVNILASNNGQTNFEGKLEAMVANDSYKIDEQNTNGNLSIGVVVPDDAFASFVGELTVKVPANVSVNVTNTSGYINIEGLAENDVTVSTVQGKITAQNSNGTISLKSKGGSITASKLTGTVSTSSSSGAQKLSDMNGTLSFDSPDGELVIDNMSGTINVTTIAAKQTLTNIEGTLNIKGSSGQIRISNATGIFNIKTMAAAVNLCETVGEYHSETTKGAIVGQKKIKFTASSDFTTTEGKIQIQLANAKEEVTFMLECESSKVGLIAKGTSKKKKLQMGKGPIVIKTHSKTGGQVFS